MAGQEKQRRAGMPPLSRSRFPGHSWSFDESRSSPRLERAAPGPPLRKLIAAWSTRTRCGRNTYWIVRGKVFDRSRMTASRASEVDVGDVSWLSNFWAENGVSKPRLCRSSAAAHVVTESKKLISGSERQLNVNLRQPGH